MLIAEYLRLYPGTPVDTCLTMAVSRFFALLRAGRYLKAMDLVEQCDISAISGHGPQYFKAVRARFEKEMVHYSRDPLELKEDEIKTNGVPVLKADSQEAKDYMFALFAEKKRSMGHR